jgi:hypothetical protein
MSASDTTVWATVMAAYRSGAVTVTTLVILSARCELMMLADLLHAAWSAAAANAAGSGREPLSHPTVTAMLWRLSGSCMSGTVSPVSDIFGLWRFTHMLDI